MLCDLSLTLITALRDGRFAFSPPNHMVGASIPGTVNSDVRESGCTPQPLSHLLCIFRRFERNKAASAPAANRDGEQNLTVSAADRNRKIQQPRIIRSCRMPHPVHCEG